ncbi:MFS transporter [Salinigranum halophilum]|uniref:MFS transporter n=1 Tax=Salinigranum halophilum TaxID=2565931 RepID=UPI0010A75A98|nr:MFS transporter [Salinigranum halophilum]
MDSITQLKAECHALGRDLWSGGRGWILVWVAVGWALSIGVRFVYPALVPFLRSEFGIDLATTGLLLTLLWGAYALGHVPGGVLGDRIGEGNILVLSAVVSAAALTLVVVSIDLWMLFVGTVAFGVATALYGPTRFTILTDIYTNRVGAAIGLTLAAGSVGNAVLPVLAAIVAGYTTWRFGFSLFVPAFGLLAVGLWITVPRRTSSETSAVETLSIETVREIWRGITLGSIPAAVSIQVTVSFIIQGFSSFYPTYLTIVKGISPGLAATLFGLFFAAGAVVQPVAGMLMDRVGMWQTLAGFVSGTAAALWLLPFATTVPQLLAVTVLLSCWNGCGVITQTHIADSLPETMQGTGLGVLKAGWMTVGATSPFAIGLLADNNYFDQGFLLLAVVGTVGVVLSVQQALK